MRSVGDIPPGIYRGVVSGAESGHCTARIEVRPGPVDYADETLSWAWDWGNPTEDIAERSRATCPRADC